MDTMTLVIGKIVIPDAMVQISDTIRNSVDAWVHLYGSTKIPHVTEVWLMTLNGSSYVKNRKLSFRSSWRDQNIPANARILFVTPWTD